MESKNENQNQTDAEILAELKRLNAIMTKRRRTPKTKEPIDKTENNENYEVKKKGRPIAEWRHSEDGKYNKQAIDPEYSTQYWRENFLESHSHVRFVKQV